MELGKRVNARRRALKLSQGELAARIGLKSRSAISKIEAGSPTTQNTIMRLAQALDVTVPYLMGWEDSPEEQAEFEASILQDDDLMEIVHFYKGMNHEQKVAFKQIAKMLSKI